MRSSSSLTRREFLSASGAALAANNLFSPALFAETLGQDPRIADTPLVEKGFAAVRRIGEGVYATISDRSKGPQTLCNGGFVAGKDAALLFEGHLTPAGAAFELEALRMVSQAPVRAAVNSHYHFDHTLGNAYYGAQGIPIWAHAKVAPLMAERYATLQGADRAAQLAPYEKKVKDAKDEVARQRAQGNLGAFTFVLSSVQSSVLALPNEPLDPAKLPMTVDLGGVKATFETHPGHTPTDVIVRIAEQNLTFAGDLLFNGWYPVTFDADIIAWRAVMNTFAGYGKDALFVPGHGAICGQDGITGQMAVMDDVGEQADKFFRAGVPLAEAQSRYTVPERFKGHVLFAWAFCIDGAIAGYYAAWKKARAPAKKS